MADKSFGVKELNLLNASGTPTVTSPNNLNLNANTVAISTSCTIGNNLTITSTTTSANVNVTGITTVVNFNATGVSTIAQPSNTNAHSLWDVVNNSASAYRFTGPGQDGAEDNPNIYLVRGQRYIFKVNASGHPFQLRVANGGAAYSDGVTNNGAQSGNVVFNVQHDAPAQLYYQCTSHGGMVGNIYIVGGPQVISGVVTATTFSGSGASLTNLPAANLTGTLPAISGANLTSLPAQATIANNADNRVITGGSGVNLNGEANLTFDGSLLTATNTGSYAAHIGGSVYYFKIGQTSTNSSPRFDAIGSNVAIPFAINGTEKIRIDLNGNLLVGATTYQNGGFGGTSAGINIAGTQPQILLHETDTDKDGYFGLAASILRIQTADAIPVTIWTSDTERLRVTSTGNIGINETSPQQLLHVHNDTSYQGIFINGNGAPRLAFARSTTTTGEWSLGIDGTNGNDFAITQSNDNSNRKLIISSAATTASGALVSGGSCTAYGNFIVGTAGNGIDFSVTSNASETGASMSNELLDDYEEGSWTVSLKIANYNFNGAYTSQSGKYTKVGNKVTVSCYLQLSSKGNDSGALKIEGLPFTSASGNGSRGSGSVGYYQGMSGMDHPMLILIEQSDTKISLRQSQSTGSGNVDDSNITNSFGMFFSLTYFT